MENLTFYRMAISDFGIFVSVLTSKNKKKSFSQTNAHKKLVSKKVNTFSKDAGKPHPYKMSKQYIYFRLYNGHKIRQR